MLGRLKVEHAARYSSHGFRRGAANELKTKGPQWSAIATLGEWRSLAFKGYIDLTQELSRDMSKLLAETDPILSVDEREVRPWVRDPKS